MTALYLKISCLSELYWPLWSLFCCITLCSLTFLPIRSWDPGLSTEVHARTAVEPAKFHISNSSRAPYTHLLIYSASLHPYLAFWLSLIFTTFSIFFSLWFCIFFFGLTPTFLVCFRFWKIFQDMAFGICPLPPDHSHYDFADLGANLTRRG